jgi:hypothetical protein
MVVGFAPGGDDGGSDVVVDDDAASGCSKGSFELGGKEFFYVHRSE